jgi:hypothetical protein
MLINSCTVVWVAFVGLNLDGGGEEFGRNLAEYAEVELGFNGWIRGCAGAERWWGWRLCRITESRGEVPVILMNDEVVRAARVFTVGQCVI